mmetsp:Transcript_37914/g.66838  ORF Transcript_37914/g.66838 Transcript_37914/m.66838 type:complete len:309 (-) Transcript_37914:56-982(-)
MPAFQSMVRLDHHLINVRMDFWTQICRALTISIPLGLLDGVCSQLSIVGVQLMCGCANVLEKVFYLRQDCESPIGLLHHSGAHLAACYVLVHHHARVKAESIVQGLLGILLLANQSDATRVVFVARLHHKRHLHGLRCLLLALLEKLAAWNKHAGSIQQLLGRRLVGCRPNGVLVVAQKGDAEQIKQRSIARHAFDTEHVRHHNRRRQLGDLSDGSADGNVGSLGYGLLREILWETPRTIQMDQGVAEVVAFAVQLLATIAGAGVEQAQIEVELVLAGADQMQDLAALILVCLRDAAGNDIAHVSHIN